MNQNGVLPWYVTAQQETSRPIAGGQVARGVLITFALQNGQQGTVFVDEAHYNPDYVRAAIADKAATMTAIGNLSG